MADKAPLPADEGRIAYYNRKTPDANPYPEGDWKHDEWYFGWSTTEECDPEQLYDWSTDSFKSNVPDSLIKTEGK